jgi:hypothetical protein
MSDSDWGEGTSASQPRLVDAGWGDNPGASQPRTTIAERIALRTQYLREWVAGGIMLLFVVANVVTLGAVYMLVQLDQGNLQGHLITPADRIITNQVIMTLLGATAVQVGAIAVIIARYLFPGAQQS